MNDQPESLSSTGEDTFKAGENQYASLVKSPDHDAAPSDEVGLRRTETEDQLLVPENIESIVRKAGDLRGISEIQRGLEKTIIGGGLQTMADRFGADKLLDALTSTDPHVITIAEVAAVLVPDKNDRAALFEAIRQEPIDALANKFNETVGGVAGGVDNSIDGLARFRKFQMMDIADGKATDGSNALLTRDFTDLLKNHPQLVDNFRTTNDTVGLLKGIRTVYESEYAQYTADLEAAFSKIDELVANGEAEVAELQSLSDDIYDDEVTRLEAKVSTVTNPEAVSMIQQLVDRRRAEAQAAHAELTARRGAVRGKIVSDLGADALTRLHIPAPDRPQLIRPE